MCRCVSLWYSGGPTCPGLGCVAITEVCTTQVDNGITWTEPTAMIYGSPDGGDEVRPLHDLVPALLDSVPFTARMDSIVKRAAIWNKHISILYLCVVARFVKLRFSPRPRNADHTTELQVPVRVHDACFTSGTDLATMHTW